MFLKRLGLAGLLVLGTAACTDGYGYSGVAVGYGPGYYGAADPYYGYGDPYGYGGYGVGSGYFGWYGDYYYPGNGVYVYDQYRRPYRWNDNQRRYWEGRRGNYRGDGRGNWNGFRRDGNGYQGARPGGDRQWQYQGARPAGDGYRGNRQWQGNRPEGGWQSRGERPSTPSVGGDRGSRGGWSGGRGRR